MEKKKVLLVDDVNLFLQLGKTMLQRKGIEVETARSGVEALEVLEKSSPDIIFLDLYLPDLSGGEICRRLRTSNTAGNIPVVLLVSGGDDDIRTMCLSAGFDDFITKPLQPDAVQAVLERHLEDRARRKQRAEVNLPCTIDQSGAKEDGVILSLSPYGAFVEMNPPTLPGQAYTLGFALPGNEPVVLSADPRWSRKMDEDTPTGSGFEFKDVEVGVFAMISDYVNELLP
jgi:CheY-like chemotaxis protein